MSNNERTPGLVNEETVPIGSGLAENPESVETSAPDDGIKRKTMQKSRPAPITEPTVLTPQESSYTNEQTLELSKGGRWSRLFLLFVLFAVCWLLYATLVSLIDAWNTSYWFAIPLGIITSLFIILLGYITWREWRAFNYIDRIQQSRQQLTQYIKEDSVVGVHATLKPALDSIRHRYPQEYRQFDEARSDRQTVKEYLSLLENVVLIRLDKDVNDAIKKAALSVAGLVAISPHPALDATIIMIRANMLLREISRIYGLELTGLSSLYLFKHTIVSAITAAGIEELGTLALEEIGAGLTEKATKILMEGMVSATRMYRLGRLAKSIIRPVPINTAL